MLILNNRFGKTKSMDTLSIFFIVVLVIHLAIATLLTRYFQKYTKGKKLEYLYNTLIFIAFFMLCLGISFFILANTFTLER